MEGKGSLLFSKLNRGMTTEGGKKCINANKSYLFNYTQGANEWKKKRDDIFSKDSSKPLL